MREERSMYLQGITQQEAQKPDDDTEVQQEIGPGQPANDSPITRQELQN